MKFVLSKVSSSINTITLTSTYEVILKILNSNISMHVEKNLCKLTLTLIGINPIDRDAKCYFRYLVLKLVDRGKLLLENNGAIQIIEENNMKNRCIDVKNDRKNSKNENILNNKSKDVVGEELNPINCAHRDTTEKEVYSRVKDYNNIGNTSENIAYIIHSKSPRIQDNRILDDGSKTCSLERKRGILTILTKGFEITKNVSNYDTENKTAFTRLFIGNLPFSADEKSLETFLSPSQELLNGVMSHVKWIVDKKTQKFYGSAFVEMKNSVFAAMTIKRDRTKWRKRSVKLNYAPARDRDMWPPNFRSTTDLFRFNKQNQENKRKKCRMGEKPIGCKKLYIGNLSNDIDENIISSLFSTIEVRIKKIIWLHHTDTGKFRGCGFVELSSTNYCEKIASLDGKMVLGRPIKIDWAH